jgi:integrase
MPRLNARKVDSLKAPGMHLDGGGLYLLIGPGGAKTWILRTTLHGRRVELGLGPVWQIGLADAREKARRWRSMARDGTDPRQAERRAARTFRDAAADFHAAHSTTWAEGHAARWWSQFEQHLAPALGGLRLAEIEAAQLVDVLAPLWAEKHETGRRLLQRIGAIFETEIAAQRHPGPNPTQGMRRALPKVRAEVAHHAAMPWQEVPGFYARLVEGGTVTGRALAFAILTAARSGEVRGACWAEIDMDGALWIIPAGRMKTREAHEVPLPGPAVQLLDGVKGLGDDLVFPSPSAARKDASAERPLSSVGFDRVLRRLDAGAATAHGFRTSFRSWCADNGVDRELAELCLAHRIGSAVEQAYQRSSLLDRRRVLVERWAQHVTGQDAARVVSLRR